MGRPPWGEREVPRERYWQSLAGVITAIAALITAVVGVVAFVFQVTGSTPDHRNDPAATARAQQPTRLAAPAPSTSRPPPTQAEAKGAGPYEMLFNNNGLDLDADPPRVATGSDPEIDVYDASAFSTHTIASYPIWSGLAKWNEPGTTPTRKDCIALLNSFATSDSTFTTGSRFCVHTRGEQHIAFVEIVGPMSDGWKIRVIVWPGEAS